MSRVEPNRNVYVGHRYVPKIFGEWDKKNEYEGLSIVTHQGASYTSKKRVPTGIDILNKEFWSLTGNYNAQVEYYRDETERVSEKLDEKSDQTYVDTELDKKANQTYVNTELGKKSDKTYVDTELGKKANKSYVDTELGKKSDKTYVDTELDKKANQTYVNTELGKKSDITYVDNELRTHALNIERFGAVSLDIDPAFDSSQSINNALIYADENGISDINIPNKDYGVANPIELKSGIKLKTQSGTLKVLDNSQWQTKHSGRGVLEYVNIENTTTENIKIVGNNSDLNNAYNGILLMNTHSNYFKGVHLKNLGGVETIPSTGLIRGISRDATNDLGVPEKYKNVVGSVKDNTFIKCVVELTSEIKNSFGVRMLSNWEKNRSLENTQNRTENNNFVECHVIGEYFWNHLEYAGSGTVNNSVKECYFTGNSATAIDIDKGSSLNTIDNNFIENVGLPSAHLNNQSLYLAVINVHGTSSGLRSNGNTIINNKILNSDNTATRNHSNNASVLSVLEARDNVFENNFIDGINNGVSGAGIHISHDAVNNTFSKNIIRNTRNGVTTNLNSSTHERNKIINNDFYNVRSGISYGGVSESNIEDVIINDNRMFLLGHTSYGILITDACHSPILKNNIVYNGFEGISSSAPLSIIEGNKVINAESRSFRINSVGRSTVINNSSVTPGLDDIIIVKDIPLMYGNIFNKRDLHGGITTFNTAAPTEGEWYRGDKVYATLPRSGGFIGWVCTTSGTPGTWKGFGLIEENEV